MPKYVFTAPDGKKITVQGPDGSTQEQAFEIAQQQYQPGPSFGEKAKGVAEVGAHMIGSAVAEPIAGIAGIGGSLSQFMPVNAMTGRGKGRGVEAVEKVRSAADFLAPRSETGQQYAQNLGETVAPVFEAIDRGAEDMAGGNPLVATALQTFALGAPELLGLKGVGAASRVAKSAAKSAATPAPKPAPAPSIDELFTEGKSLFDQVDKAGVTIKPQATQKFAQDLASKVKAEGIDPDITPAAQSAMNRIIQDAQQGSLSFNQVETLRKVANNAAGSINKADARMANIIIDEIDGFIDGLDAAKVSAGNADVAKTSIKSARDYWNRARKAEDIQTLFEKAKNAVGPRGQGFDEKLRIQFKQLADNPKRFKRFNKAERAAILKVVRGGPVSAALGLVASFAPRGIVSGALGGGIGFALGGPVGSAAVMAGGEVARRVGAARRVNAAEQISEMVRRGTP